ncbi:MAG: Cell surface glycoprotein [Methanothrix sp.]|jgi:nitrous oxidase accessory protein|nr:MAG: Cell surface glycoprotein [Methanothrix sp.]
MLRDTTHKRAIAGFFALAILLFAGLAQGADSADGINASLIESSNGSINDSINASENAVEPSILGADATSGVQEMEDIDLEEATGAVGDIENETAVMVEAGESEEPVTVDIVSATTIEADNVSISEEVPKKAEAEVGEALPVTHYVCLNGCAFTTIQAAIEAAVDGDTVEVGSGTYSENVVVDKRITLRGVDTGEGVPVVNAASNGSAVLLEAGGSVLEGLHITNSGPHPSAGIEVVSSDNIISGCSIWNSGWWGIYLKGGSTNNTVANSIASNSVNDGIMVFRSPGNRFVENTIMNNGDNGIQILESEKNVVERNVVGNNTNSGISLESSQNSEVKGNVITYNSVGIQLLNSGIDRVGPNRFLGNGREMGIA